MVSESTIQNRVYPFTGAVVLFMLYALKVPPLFAFAVLIAMLLFISESVEEPSMKNILTTVLLFGLMEIAYILHKKKTIPKFQHELRRNLFVQYILGFGLFTAFALVFLSHREKQRDADTGGHSPDSGNGTALIGDFGNNTNSEEPISDTEHATANLPELQTRPKYYVPDAQNVKTTMKTLKSLMKDSDGKDDFDVISQSTGHEIPKSLVGEAMFDMGNYAPDSLYREVRM